MREVAEFLNKDLSNKVIEKIAENCSFDKLKAASDTLKRANNFGASRETKSSSDDEKNEKKYIYRKGIGHFQSIKTDVLQIFSFITGDILVIHNWNLTFRILSG